MKSLISLTAVLLITIFNMADIVAAEDCTFEEKIEDAVEKSMEAALELSENLQEKIHERRKGKTDREYDRLLALMQRVQVHSSNYEGQILVIPDEQVNVEQMARVTEDMTVMSRILDKKIHPGSSLGIGYDGYGSGSLGGYGRSYLDCQFFTTEATTGIYLENYGAVFVAKVDFPLVSPVDSNEPNKVNDTEDKLWRETKMEIYDPEKSHRYVEMHKEHKSGPDYDAVKVEQLKIELVKALKHAANIRDLNADNQRVIITVIGGGRSVVNTVLSYGGGYGRGGGGYGGRGGYGGGHTVEVPTTLGARSVLTIWARKVDIDRFAKGETDIEDFRSNVKILIY